MRFLLLFLAFTSLSFANVTPRKSAPPTEEEVEDVPTMDDLRKTILHIQQLAKENEVTLGETLEENERLKTAVNAATQSIVQSQTETQAVKKEEADLKQRWVEENARADKEAKESARRGNFIGLLAAVAMISLSLHLLKVCPPYSFALPLLAGPAGYFLARFLI